MFSCGRGYKRPTAVSTLWLTRATIGVAVFWPMAAFWTALAPYLNIVGIEIRSSRGAESSDMCMMTSKLGDMYA